jgi:hypothetical protein
VSYFTLRIIIILMETIEDLYISGHMTPTAARPLRGKQWFKQTTLNRWESGTQSRIRVPY